MKELLLPLSLLFLFSCAETQKPDESASITNAERIQKIYMAFGEGDIETVLANFDSTIEWNEAENYIYADGNPYIGGEAVLEGVFKRIGEEWEYWDLDGTQFFNVDSNRVLVTGRYKAKNKATGQDLDAQFAHVWTLKDTLATSFQQYTDTKQAAEVIMADEEE